MASVEDCRNALEQLIGQLAGVDSTRKNRFLPDRTISCVISDCDTAFSGAIQRGAVVDVKETSDTKAQIQFTIDSATLIAITDGSITFGKAVERKLLTYNAGLKDRVMLGTLGALSR
jgi:hypothetical protein